MADASGNLHPTVMDPMSAPLAAEYALALSQLTANVAEAGALDEELQAVVASLDELPGMEDLLVRAPLSKAVRTELVTRVFAGRLDEKLMGLLVVLTRNDRLGLLRSIADRFARVVQKRQGKVEVSVATAVELDEGQLQAIRQSLQEALGAAPVLKLSVDANLLGGMVVRVGDRVFDDSIAARLQSLRKDLLEKAALQT